MTKDGGHDGAHRLCLWRGQSKASLVTAAFDSGPFATIGMAINCIFPSLGRNRFATLFAFTLMQT
jgi:hypothetical protein